MLVALLCVITTLTFVCTTSATCFKFFRKKTDLPYGPANRSPTPRSLSPGSRLKKKSPKIFKRSALTPRRTFSRQSSTSATTNPLSPTTTAASTETKPISASKEALSGSALTDGKRTMRVEKTQPISSQETVKEELGDVQLVKAKPRKDIVEILKNCPKLDKKSSEEFISDSTRSLDDTLRGAESLKTDNLTSLAPRSSIEAVMKHLKANTETVK
ncbi:hypothetical protein COOONC_05470 [Cooperia oncophora]